MISPVPGSLRPGLSASWMCAIRARFALIVRGEFAFHQLHVIDVVLQEQVGRARFGDQIQRLRRPAEVEARNVAGVDRLDQQPDARRAAAGPPRSAGWRRTSRAAPSASTPGGAMPDEAIDLRAAERLRVVDRLADAVLEFADPIGEAGDPALAFRPVAGRQIVQHLHERVLARAAPPVAPWRYA